MHRIALTFLLTLALAACKEDPPNTPGAWGESCNPGEAVDTPDGCEDGLECWISGNQGLDGFCTGTCDVANDCRQHGGFVSLCSAGKCTYLCEGVEDCPQDLDVGELQCSCMDCDHGPGYCSVAD